MYAYYGKVTGEALALAGQAPVARDTSYYALLFAGLAATVAWYTDNRAWWEPLAERAALKK